MGKKQEVPRLGLGMRLKVGKKIFFAFVIDPSPLARDNAK
jgi:hypothetical protein